MQEVGGKEMSTGMQLSNLIISYIYPYASKLPVTYLHIILLAGPFL